MRPGRFFSSLARKRVWLWSAPLLWIGCGGGSTDVVLPALNVMTRTQGVEIDPDGYQVAVDATQDQPIGANDTLVVDQLTDGDHTLRLDGLAPNCGAGENPRTVVVRAGVTASEEFAVVCSATTGSLEIRVTVTGAGSDADGFIALLDGVDQGSIFPGPPATLPQIPLGAHTVGLGGLAANCRVLGNNPVSVTLAAGEDLEVPFSVDCSQPAQEPGGIQITVATTGNAPDADGYSVSVDGGTGQTIQVNGNRTVTGLAPGSHSVQLADVAANCTVGGANPQTVAVTSGQNTPVAFAVTCTQPPAETGGIQVTASTTGSPADPNGYTVSVDGGSGQSLQVNGSRTITGLTPGAHSVQLADIAANCVVAETNPQSITVTAGQNAPAKFTVTCSATTGSIKVTASTLGNQPDPDGYSVSVDGGTGKAVGVNGSTTFDGLQPGNHQVQLSGTAANCTVGGTNPRPITVTAGQTAAVAFDVNCPAPGPSVNLKIEGMYLTQSTQTPSGGVPLVEGRDAYLRVFVTAGGANNIRPDVRVRIFRSGSSTPTLTQTIPGGEGITPTGVQEGNFSSSWNLLVSGADIQPNTRVLADVDPTNAISEPDETDNNFPTTGTPQPLNVQSVPAASITFVPIKQAGNGLTGTVNNPTQLVERARRMYPLQEIRTSTHELFTTSTTDVLEPFDDNKAWNTILGELDALRVFEGSGDTYFGMVKVSYGPGINGIGYVGVPTAMGSDDAGQVQRMVAHELGHTWGRWHSPCGNPGGLDPNHPYPYDGGVIGAFGLEVAAGNVKLPSQPDIMSYCPNEWISDYTYQNVLSFRSSSQSVVVTSGAAQSALLVWGHIVNGRPVVEPSFQVTTRPTMPTRPGPYTVQGLAADGSRLFAVSFDAAPTADARSDSRNFAFAVPLDAGRLAQLRGISLSGPGGQAAITAPVQAAQVNPGSLSDEMSARQGPQGVTLKWNSQSHPMIVVRDPDNGQVLSFARGGTATVATGKRQVDLEVSDGVRSQRVRLAISR